MPDLTVLERLTREGDVVHDGDYAEANFRMPVSIAFEKTIPIYYLYDTDGCVIEKIEVENMPKNWRKLFEGDAA